MKIDSGRLLVSGTSAGFVVLMLLVCFLKPGATPWLPPCPLYKFAGLYCPGCGSTRMLYFLVHGHPWLAFRQNALAMITLPFLVYGLVRQTLAPNSGVYSRISPKLIVALCIVFALFAVARNIPVPPFCWLAPGGESCGRMSTVSEAGSGCDEPLDYPAISSIALSDSAYGARSTPRSVMIAVTYFAGVTSNAGLQMPTPCGVSCFPP